MCSPVGETFRFATPVSKSVTCRSAPSAGFNAQTWDLPVKYTRSPKGDGPNCTAEMPGQSARSSRVSPVSRFLRKSEDVPPFSASS